MYTAKRQAILILYTYNTKTIYALYSIFFTIYEIHEKKAKAPE